MWKVCLLSGVLAATGIIVLSPSPAQAATLCQITAPEISMPVSGIIVAPPQAEATDAIENGVPYNWIIVLDAKTGCRVVTNLQPLSLDRCLEGMKASFYGVLKRSPHGNFTEDNYDYGQTIAITPHCQ